jgi:hypothetical protein
MCHTVWVPLPHNIDVSPRRVTRHVSANLTLFSHIHDMWPCLTQFLVGQSLLILNRVAHPCFQIISHERTQRISLHGRGENYVLVHLCHTTCFRVGPSTTFITTNYGKCLADSKPASPQPNHVIISCLGIPLLKSNTWWFAHAEWIYGSVRLA